MKTSRQDARLESQNSPDSRRQRTRSAFTCESLEGRKLMTGFAGGTGAMVPPGGPTEMSSLTESGSGQAGDSIRFKGARNDVSTNSTDVSSTPSAGISTPNGTRPDESGMMTTFASISGGAGARDFSKHRGEFDSNAGGGSDWHGGMMEGRPGGWMTAGHDHGDMSMPGQTSSTDEIHKPTGDTQLDTDLAKLRTDEQAIHDKSEVTPKLLAAVRNDLQAIDQAKTGTADPNAVQTLKTDEQTIFASQTAPTDAQQTQLQADQDAVLKSQGVSQELIDQLAADLLADKTASHFTADDQTLLDADRKAIEADQTAAQPTTDSGSATPETAAPTTTATPATATSSTTTATPPDQAGVAAATAAASTDATTRSATPPMVNPMTSPVVQLSMNEGSIRSGRPALEHAAHHGRPTADGSGATGHHGPMSRGGANHARRSMRNGG